MSEMSAVENIVALSVNGDAGEVKSAINSALQQKILVALEDKRKDIASTFLTKTEADPKGPESSGE
jgi:hypothetical protein